MQAISDAYAETTLWIRLHPEETGKLLAADPQLSQFPQPLIEKQTLTYNNFYKPTYIYPFAKFWGEENARIASFLFANKRITLSISAPEYQAAYDESFMQATFKKARLESSNRAAVHPERLARPYRQSAISAL